MEQVAYREVSLNPLRKIIAHRMQEAKQTIPHYRLSIDIEVDDLQAARERHNRINKAARVSINDYVIMAVAKALVECPAINCQFVDGVIREYGQADISVVMAVDGGLTTPVVRNANKLSVIEISSAVKSLAARAKQGQLKMDEITGGSFSISNLGMYNLDQFDAIINPPQCAIMAVASARPRVVSRCGEFVEISVMRVSLSLDHRVIDGAIGAEFLNRVKHLVEVEIPQMQSNPSE